MEKENYPCLIEMTLISAQDLKPPSTILRHSPSFYAVAWIDPSHKLRTLTDHIGGTSPTWNDRFLFLVPSVDSAAAVSIEIYAAGHFCISSSLAGSVRLLLSTLNLNGKPPGTPSFAALGVRRPSGRFQGILNIAAAIAPRVSLLAERAISLAPALAYRDLIAPRRQTSMRRKSHDLKAVLSPVPLKAINREEDERAEGEKTDVDAAALCGLGFRKINVGSSNQNLQIGWGDENCAA